MQQDVEDALKDNNESWNDVIASRDLPDGDPDPGSVPRFVVWTKNFVYYPDHEDGYYLCVYSVPRNPPGESS